MFKFLMIIGLVYLLYRMTIGPSLSAGNKPKINRSSNQHTDEDDFVEYEEIE